MKTRHYILSCLLLVIINSCITQFIPDTNENRETIVIEGLITDQPGGNTIKLSKSMPLGLKSSATPLSGCSVWITDDIQNSYFLYESSKAGSYVTPSQFHGTIGRKYTLHIKTNNSYTNSYSFESLPMEMKPVPAIDSIYYEKIPIKSPNEFIFDADGCQIYLNTQDPSGACKYFRWDYNETWELHLPYSRAINPVCWVSGNSDAIYIKNTSVLAEDIIERFPLNFIDNNTDRLKVKYSILVNQYSLNEDEFIYWEKLQNITQNIGSLYDLVPASIPSNVLCVENPSEKVLGYFSVSAKSSKRIFIKDNFHRIVDLYSIDRCIYNRIISSNPIIPNLNVTVWILEQNIGPNANPPYTDVTGDRGCADCTVRGTKIKPDFWTNNY